MAVFVVGCFTGLKVIGLYGIISISINCKYLRTRLAGISGYGMPVLCGSYVSNERRIEQKTSVKMDYYNELIEKAKHHKYLYHNTNVDSLSLILKNRSLKLNRLDKVNDADENKRITSPWNNRVFVACFSHETQTENYFFENYGTVRLTFKNDEVYNVKEVFFDAELKKPVPIYDKNIRYEDITWSLYERIMADIKYVDDLDKYVLDDGNETNAGLIKKVSGYDNNNNFRNWNEEYETRIRVAVRPLHFEAFAVGLNKYKYYNPEFDSLFMRLPEIEGIKVSPTITGKEKNELVDILKQYNLKSILR